MLQTHAYHIMVERWTTDFSECKISFGSSDKKRLTVLNPGKSEEGFYECRATNPNDGQQTSRRANLTITGTYLQVLFGC